MTEREKKQNFYNLFIENFFTKAMKEETENKNSQGLSRLSVCALFPFKH